MESPPRSLVPSSSIPLWLSTIRCTIASPNPVPLISEIDVKAIREATGLRQQDFAVAVGVSYDLVKSWETKRRQPTGAPRKLLLLLQANPFIINQLKTI